MQRNIQTRLLVLIFSLLVIFGGSRSAHSAIYAGSDGAWLVVSSHSYQQDAINRAQQYVRDFPTTTVFSSSNGFFVVSLGWARKHVRDNILNDLKLRGRIPSDSYFSKGARWLRPLWTANSSHFENLRSFVSATQLYTRGSGSYNQPPVNPPTPQQPDVSSLNPTPAEVYGLQRTRDKFLSLRRGPGTSFGEIVRMRQGTRLTITGKSKRWYRVELDNGMKGFAHSKYIRQAEIPVVGPDKKQEEDIKIVGPVEDKKEKPPVIINKDENDVEPADFSDQKRVALVLGNSDYQHTAALANPKNDADAIASKLERLGFTVIKGLDLTKSGMEKSIRDFVRVLDGADVALFFYAGHAMQVKGQNYLIPIDAALEDSTAIDFETINFSVILEFMNESDRTSIALLDACRNNPLARNFTRKLGKTRSAFVGRGLAAPTSNTGQLLIGFATAPGEVALDGDGQNSPFTTALLEHMDTPGLEIELMLKRVKNDVFNSTDGTQSPWNNSALRNEFYFKK